MTKTQNSLLPDEVIASLLGLVDLRIGRQLPKSKTPMGDVDCWVQSIWKARVLPTFDPDAFLAVVTCSQPWQPAADPRPSLWHRSKRLFGVKPASPSVGWRKAVFSLQGDPTVIEMREDPVADALRVVDLFETYEYDSMDGISYSLDVETWNINTTITFGNPEVPSLKQLAKSLLAVGREVSRSSGNVSVAEYVKLWTRYES